MVSEGGGSAGRKTFALVLLCCASFVAVLDLTIVAIALPSVRRELGFTGGDVQWILTGYALTFGGLLLFMGRAGDLYGRRRLFVGGLALFAAASLLGGLAWAPWVLVVARLLQGVGGAALVPASLALVSATFAEGEERNRAMGVYGAMAGGRSWPHAARGRAALHPHDPRFRRRLAGCRKAHDQAWCQTDSGLGICHVGGRVGAGGMANAPRRCPVGCASRDGGGRGRLRDRKRTPDSRRDGWRRG